LNRFKLFTLITVKRSNEEEMNKIKKIAPETSKINKENPFRVPSHYFDDFSARLQPKLKAESGILPQPRNRIIRYLKPVLGLAASFALIFLLVYWPVNTFLRSYLAKTEIPAQTATEYEQYIGYIERIDENSFFALIIDPFMKEDAADDHFDDDDLLTYLSDNVSDYELFAHIHNE
jgi:hypothetical protein